MQCRPTSDILRTSLDKGRLSPASPSDDIRCAPATQTETCTFRLASCQSKVAGIAHSTNANFRRERTREADARTEFTEYRPTDRYYNLRWIGLDFWLAFVARRRRRCRFRNRNLLLLLSCQDYMFSRTFLSKRVFEISATYRKTSFICYIEAKSTKFSRITRSSLISKEFQGPLN